MNKLEELAKNLNLTKEETERLSLKIKEYSKAHYRGIKTLKDKKLLPTGEIADLDNKMCRICPNKQFCKKHSKGGFKIYWNKETGNCWITKNEQIIKSEHQKVST